MCAYGMPNKLVSFNRFAFAFTFKIFAIAETWLSDHIFDREILPANFIVYRNDRTSRGGGVMLAIDLSIPNKIISSSNEIEIANRCPNFYQQSHHIVFSIQSSIS